MTGLTKEGLHYVIEKGNEGKFDDVKFFLGLHMEMPTFSNLYKLVKYYGFERILKYSDSIGVALYKDGELVKILVLNENHYEIPKLRMMETV